MPSLPVISSPANLTPADHLRLFLRTEQHWFEHLAEPIELDFATHLPAPAHQLFNLRELNSHSAVADLINQTKPTRITLNPSAESSLLRELLQQNNFAPTTRDVFRLTTPHVPDYPTPTDLRIIPARASLKHTQQIAAQLLAERNDSLSASDYLLHLDDPHVDSLLALQAGQPIGLVHLLSVGDMGRIDDLYIVPTHRRRGIAKLLLTRTIETGARSLFKHVYAAIARNNEPACTLFDRFAFQKVTTTESFEPRPR